MAKPPPKSLFDRLTPRLRAAVACVAAIAGLAVVGNGVASAQSWWPFETEERRPPVPAEPVYRPDAQPVPAPIPQPGAAANTWSSGNPICLQLERRLVQESQRGSSSRDLLPAIENELRTVDRTYNVGATKLERSCYEYFLFAKTFRNTPQCKELAREVDVSKRRLAELEAQRQDITNASGRSFKDDIIRELARNNCGANYADQARRRDGGIWQDEESVSGNVWSPQGLNGVATYRTICVRLCDGYYFPVSFSTLPSHFPQDAEACTSRCAAPTELYYYPNPGGSVDQSVALSSQQPYTTLKSAFRYRKEYVNGCSCKTAEYLPEGSDKKADAGQPSATPTRASVVTRAPLTTGSTAPASPPDTAASPVESGWQPQ